MVSVEISKKKKRVVVLVEVVVGVVGIRELKKES